jgi:hypothetical protein
MLGRHAGHVQPPRGVRHTEGSVETFRPILTLVRAITDAALSSLRVWPVNPVRHCVTQPLIVLQSLRILPLLPRMESHHVFW